MSTDTRSSYDTAAAVPENNFDDALRNCELVEVINGIDLDEESTWHSNTAEDEVHQCDSDSAIRGTSLMT